jgi:hypothetical protein
MTENSGENALTNDDRTSSVKEHFNAIDIAKIAIQSANVGIWIIDTASQNFLPSNRTKELFGYLAKVGIPLKLTMCSAAIWKCVPLIFDQGVPGGLTSCSGAN